jgi:hypothetical protein
MSDAAPWEDYQQQVPDQGPWSEYAAPGAPAQAGGIMGALKGASRALEANLPFVDRAVAEAKPGDYASNLAKEQATNAQFAKDNPATNIVGGIAASAPLIALGGPSFGLGGLGGRVAASAVPPAIAGALQGASSSPDLTNVPETAGRAGIGAAEGGALGAAVPLAGAAVSPIAAGLRRGPGGADIAKLGGDVSAAYQKVKDMGAAYSPEAYQGLVGNIGQAAKDAYMDPALTPGAASVISNMQGRVGDQAMPLPELDKIRQLAWLRAGSSPSAEERMLGGKIRGSIDDFIANAGPEQMAQKPAQPRLVVAARTPEGIIYGKPGQTHGDLFDAPIWDSGSNEDIGFAQPGGPFMSRQEAADFVKQTKPLDTFRYNQASQAPGPSAQDASSAISNARDLAMRKFKADALVQALDKSEINAAKSGSGGNIENATRQRLAAILGKEPWSPDELSQLNTMIKGTPLTNTMRNVSRLSPWGNGLNLILEGGLAGIGAPGVLPAAGAGLAAQAGGALARRGAQSKLLSTILAGGKAPAAPALQIPNRAALATALAARQQLPQQQNMQR